MSEILVLVTCKILPNSHPRWNLISLATTSCEYFNLSGFKKTEKVKVHALGSLQL